MTPAPGRRSLIDKLDSRGRRVGDVARGEALVRGANFRTVHVFVFNSAGQFLLQQLAPSRERNPLQWGSSVAAYPHANEPDEETARRRLREEIGVRTIPKRFGSTMMRDGRSRKFITLFTAASDEVAIRDQSHIAALRFFNLREIDERIAATPEMFTETFRHVYSYFRARASHID